MLAIGIQHASVSLGAQQWYRPTRATLQPTLNQLQPSCYKPTWGEGVCNCEGGIRQLACALCSTQRPQT